MGNDSAIWIEHCVGGKPNLGAYTAIACKDSLELWELDRVCEAATMTASMIVNKCTRIVICHVGGFGSLWILLIPTLCKTVRAEAPWI